MSQNVTRGSLPEWLAVVFKDQRRGGRDLTLAMAHILGCTAPNWHHWLGSSSVEGAVLVLGGPVGRLQAGTL